MLENAEGCFNFITCIFAQAFAPNLGDSMVLRRGKKMYVYVHICDGVFNLRYFSKSCVNIEPKFGKMHENLKRSIDREFAGE